MERMTTERMLRPVFQMAAVAGLSEAALCRKAGLEVSAIRGWRRRMAPGEAAGISMATLAKLLGAVDMSPERWAAEVDNG